MTRRSTNRALLVHLLLPTLFLPAALAGGVRVAAEGVALAFLPPPLITLILASMLLALFVRGGAIELGGWLSSELTARENVSHALTLAALFFASAQAFNSVLPDAGLLRWMLSFFFLWTLWQNQFSAFDARRLLRSLAALFGTAFVINHKLLASVYAPGGGWLARLAGAVAEGVTLGTLGGGPQSPATGYVSFLTLALYVAGLVLLPPSPRDEAARQARADEVVKALERLPAEERARALAASDETAAAPPGRLRDGERVAAEEEKEDAAGATLDYE